MPVGFRHNRAFVHQQDSTSGAEFLAGNEHLVHKEGGIVIDKSARHAGRNPTTTLRKGLALGKITATGKYTGYDPDGSDGTEIARGILPFDIDLLDPNATAQDSRQSGMVVGCWYVPAKVTDEDGASVTATVEAQRNLFGLDGSAGTESITGCQCNPSV